MKIQPRHFTDHSPINRHRIHPSVERSMLNTREKRIRFAVSHQQLTGKPTRIVVSAFVKPYVQHLN